MFFISIIRFFRKRRDGILNSILLSAILLTLLYMFLTDGLDFGPSRNPFNVSENALFGNGKSRQVTKVYFDKAVLKAPGVLLKMKGGIGNQLFQYACSYALARDKSWPLYTLIGTRERDFSSDKMRRFLPLEREFALDHFNIPLDNLIDSTSKIRGRRRVLYDQELLEMRLDVLREVNDNDNTFLQLHGEAYCQSVEYWKPYQKEIEDMFYIKELHPNDDSAIVQTLLFQIENSESVAVHVRRGDFTQIRGFQIPISFQRNAMEEMASLLGKRDKLPVFFVFADDIQYAREELKDLRIKYDIVFVSNPSSNLTSVQEFFLMMQCRHDIIPNSTFSWWASFLNRNRDKIVIASAFNPEFNPFWDGYEEDNKFYRKLYGTLYHPKEWIVMDPFKS